MRYAVCMKSSYWKLFLSVLLVAGLMCVACKQRRAQTTVAPVSADERAGIPTEAEIANFMPRYQDPSDDKKVIVYRVTFGAARPRLMEDGRTHGKIFFAVGVDFYKQEMAGGWPNTYAIMDGYADVVVLDADGALVDRQRKDLALLCPS